MAFIILSRNNHNNFLENMEKEEYKRAEEKLKRFQKIGFDKYILNVYNANSGEYPTYERNILDKITNSKKEYKSHSESSTDYIKRILDEGKFIVSNNKFYLIKENICLNFNNSKSTNIETLEGLLTIWTGLNDTQLSMNLDKRINCKYAVEGIIPVRLHTHDVSYNGWNNSKNVFYNKENNSDSSICKILFKEGTI